jgi:crotonobetaine/carnitine-CoA ligase
MTLTIPALFEAAVSEAPEKTWLVHDNLEFTYAEARERIARAAAALAALGIGRGDLVLATARNRPEYVFLWLGAMYLGAIYVPCDPRGSETELGALAGQVQPALIVTDDDLAGEARAALELGARTVEVNDLPAAPGGDLSAGEAGEDDPAVLIPTSGTTGRSKLVTQTQRAYAMAAEGFPYWLELTSDDRLMTSLPLFHINAPAYSILGSVAARASVVLLPRFSASTFIDSARRHDATEFNAIGAMLEILMRQPERPHEADNPLRLCYTGPSPPKERQLEIEERFGFRIVCGYAMSETPYGLVWAHGTRPYGTLGSPRQHPTIGTVNEARVVDGELQLRNPAIMQGYWGMPEESERVLLSDGWLCTGDLVEDNGDGTYTFLGRKKEVIRRRGENVAPAEIEEVLMAHPDVLEAAVVGVPSDLSEEEIKAFVMVREGADLPAVREFAAGRLTRFKVPRYIEAVNELPHTPTGRVAKHRLPRERTDAEIDFEAVTRGRRPRDPIRTRGGMPPRR